MYFAPRTRLSFFLDALLPHWSESEWLACRSVSSCSRDCSHNGILYHFFSMHLFKARNVGTVKPFGKHLANSFPTAASRTWVAFPCREGTNTRKVMGFLLLHWPLASKISIPTCGSICYKDWRCIKKYTPGLAKHPSRRHGPVDNSPPRNEQTGTSCQNKT